MSRLEILAAVAGFLLILKPAAFAQSPGQPEEATEASWEVAAPNAPDEVQASTDASQAPTEDDWWGQDDGLSFGYLPGGYGFGLGSCGSWSQPTGGGAVQWWNAGVTNPWFPTGEQLPYPYGSGWCGNNGYRNRSAYGLWVNQVVISAKRNHQHGWKHKPRNEATNQSQTAAVQAARQLNADRGGPDDDWTRVEDSIQVQGHNEQAAATQRRYHQAIRAPQHGRQIEPSKPRLAHVVRMRSLEPHHLARGGVRMRIRISSNRLAAHVAARGGGHGHT
jgi:hypothetical protein